MTVTPSRRRRHSASMAFRDFGLRMCQSRIQGCDPPLRLRVRGVKLKSASSTPRALDCRTWFAIFSKLRQL